MTDIVERLRSRACKYCGPDDIEAADEIERLRLKVNEWIVQAWEIETRRDKANAEIERLQGLLCAEGANRHYWLQVSEIERLRADVKDWEVTAHKAADEIKRLRLAVSIAAPFGRATYTGGAGGK